MLSGLDEFFQTGLMVGFAIASARLVYTAWRPGRRPIRIFRAIGAFITLAWSVWYGHAAFSTASFEALADSARILQYLNLLMFLSWGFLWTETRWIREARERLAELEGHNG